MKKTVVVAMSGGVDSAVAAALLKEQKYEVIGITMCFFVKQPSPRKNKPTCCGIENIEDARRVAAKLDIRHYVLSMKVPLEKYVIDNFCSEYLRGRTPNPCVRCNQFIKFDSLLKKAFLLKADFLATGHYAKIMHLKGLFSLKKAKDRLKDQSYFLYRINQKQLKHIIFPLGDILKSQARDFAHKFGLPVALKSESQEICFLPDNNYRDFLAQRCANKIKPGNIVDKEARIIGRHKGIAFYTLGQRQGLGVALGYPAYVIGIDLRKNTVMLGPKEDACAKSFLVKDVNFIDRPFKKKVALNVRIRYNHREAPAEIIPQSNKLKVYFKKSQFAITPGQSAVFYEKDEVRGGGIIERVIE